VAAGELVLVDFHLWVESVLGAFPELRRHRI
jgi:hypothetical protein